MTAPMLVIFDVDGTLVDSQASIVSGLNAAFAAVAHAAPTRAEMLSIVGLSLPQAFGVLAPWADETTNAAMVEAYKDTYKSDRATGAVSATLYPGAPEVLAELRARDGILLGVATGKSRRGLDLLLDHHGWSSTFQTIQVADNHPSKPHPSMVFAALAEAGVAAENAVMIGDTTFDIEMAAGAGVPAIGAGWGYHAADALVGSGATRVLAGFDELLPALGDHWGW